MNLFKIYNNLPRAQILLKNLGLKLNNLNGSITNRPNYSSLKLVPEINAVKFSSKTRVISGLSFGQKIKV